MSTTMQANEANQAAELQQGTNTSCRETGREEGGVFHHVALKLHRGDVADGGGGGGGGSSIPPL